MKFALPIVFVSVASAACVPVPSAVVTLAAAATLPSSRGALALREKSSLPVNSGYKADAKKIISTISQTFSDEKKTWTHLWGYQAATIYQDLADYGYWTGTTEQKSYTDDLLQVVTTKSLFSRVGATVNYIDDRGWWMLAFLHAYRSIGHDEFLKKAESMFNYIILTSQLSSKDSGTTPNKGGLKRTLKIPKSCDVNGAVYWKLTGTSTINAVSTGLIAEVGAMLYGFTKDKKYRTAADLAINFERRRMLSSKGVINVDSFVANTCKKQGGDHTPYNTGLYIAANTFMYKATGEPKYLDWATQSVTTVVAGYYGDNGKTIVVADHYKSQDVFYRSIREYYAMIKSKNLNTSLQKKIVAFIKANADSNLAKAKKGNYFTQSYLKKDKGNSWRVAGMLGSVMSAMVMV